MRLIDADKTLEWVDYMKPIHGIGLEPVVAVETVRDLIKGAPTIDAIPVEWLVNLKNEYAREGREQAEGDLMNLLLMWKKEQGAQYGNM